MNKTTALYALYDQSFIPQAGVLRSGGTPQPITGNNQEIGIKRDWAHGLLSTTLSVYRILKENELTADPRYAGQTPAYSIELGQKVARGFEFDIRGMILPGFTAVANYAFTEAKITKLSQVVIDSTEMRVGDDVRGYAGHTINSWLEYKIQKGALKNLGIAGGFTWLMDRKTDNWSSLASSFGLPDYFRLDGSLFGKTTRCVLQLTLITFLISIFIQVLIMNG
ncbi:TonB-dependent receptor domain-containing protein [Niabella ginsengisoli]|uniref:TonB-dependent receptor domain-containing protein n=1 Tax=Niabella ginsengisoli TaxID=522298 RepID=UPI00374DCA6F